MAHWITFRLVWIFLLPWISGQDYSSQWAAHITGGIEMARETAEKHGFVMLGEIFQDHYHLKHKHISKRSVIPSVEHHENLISEENVMWAKQQEILSRSKRNYLIENKENLNDPEWPMMWYLNRGQGIDMNVQGAWSKGITGKGSVVSILDDGIEIDHPDLIQNYDPSASYDMNDNDVDPTPHIYSHHGTRCAGEVAAAANNSVCSVGVAYGAKIGGVRMLEGDITDAVEARSLSFNTQHIDVFSASWGPDDNGKDVDGPGKLAKQAMSESITKGRGGKGTIFVWASGNGGREEDDCNCDGYLNSIWTIGISSATFNGSVPMYSEACSSILVATYSSDFRHQIFTTTTDHGCTNKHAGTSASAPLAAGIVALALEANNKLTWRDIQHIIVMTARPTNLKAKDWIFNAVKRKVSHNFGYGLMDATEMVRVARQWKTVPAQLRCNVTYDIYARSVLEGSSVELELPVNECNSIHILEHVQAVLTLESRRRGFIKIQLISPSGTKSTLLAPRKFDNSTEGFRDWPFMSVHMWGERPDGKWKLIIHNLGNKGQVKLRKWSLILYGTKYPPKTPQHIRCKMNGGEKKLLPEKSISEPIVKKNSWLSQFNCRIFKYFDRYDY